MKRAEDILIELENLADAQDKIKELQGEIEYLEKCYKDAIDCKEFYRGKCVGMEIALRIVAWKGDNDD